MASRTVSSKAVSLDGRGAALVVLAPGKAVARALARKKGRFAVTVTATAGGVTKTTSGSLTR